MDHYNCMWIKQLFDFQLYKESICRRNLEYFDKYIWALPPLFHQRFVKFFDTCWCGFGDTIKKVHVFGSKQFIVLATGGSITVLTWTRLTSPELRIKISSTFQVLSIKHLLLTFGLTVVRVFFWMFWILDGQCVCRPTSLP